MPKPKRMLMLADWHKASSGFGTVTRNLLPYFQKAFDEIVLVAINYYGLPYTEGNLQVVSARNHFMPEEQFDFFGRHSFLNILAQDTKGFDVCFFIQDIGIINSLVPVMKDLSAMKLKHNQPNFKTVAYFPIDGNLPDEHFANLNFFDTLITYNDYSRSNVVEYNPSLRKKLKVIPHGTNTDDFYVMDAFDRMEFRRKYFGKNADKIIVTNINRNQPRKAIGDTILSFLEAKRLNAQGVLQKREMFLYLHMMPNDELMHGYNIRKIMSQAKLVEGVDYMLPDDELWKSPEAFTIETLRGIYNSSDVFVTNTTGEGWGLTVTEAMACGCPVVAPNHTSLIEIGGNGKRIYAMYELEPFINQFDSTIRERANVQECAENILTAAMEKIHCANVSKLELAREYAASLKWCDIAKKFINYFEELM